jgi:hypothetical protein
MILVLINALIIVVIGAILFWVIDRFVWNIQLANLLKNSHGADLSCWNPATIATGARRIVVLAGGRKKAPTGPGPQLLTIALKRAEEMYRTSLGDCT